ncbi:vWA domain-containing protein [Aneurinibacillus sp. REN35]|uniref:vWA domain-containing protein n=1 Tax=Aneurinibacillus sp. REN35 TaxID=3237286 RepID=UPI0035296C3E
MHDTLSGHVAKFCSELRRNSIAIGPAEIRDALLALDTISLVQEEDFRQALRLTLCSSPEEQEKFDRLFRLYFHAPRKSDKGIRIFEEAAVRSKKRKEKDARQSGRTEDREHTESDSRQQTPGHVYEAEGNRTKEEGKAFSLAARVSIRKSNRTVSLRIPEEKEEQLISSVRAFIRTLRRRQSRRFVPVKRGPIVDLRRTLRQSVAYEGEALLVAHKARARKEAKFVVLCDGSRSMAGVAERVLQFAWALTHAAKQVEVFLFSTHLTRITTQMRQARLYGKPELTVYENEWGSGTRIGESLTSFVTSYGARLLGRDTVVIIASDGLDTGASRELACMMRRIQSRTAGIIWLNPFLSIPGYRPETKGMKAALPFIDGFVAVDSIFACSRWTEHIQTRR